MIYNLLFQAAAEALLSIAADPKHLSARKRNLARARELLISDKTDEPEDAETNGGNGTNSGNRDASATYLCPDCGAPMLIIETFERGQLPRAPSMRINAS